LSLVPWPSLELYFGHFEETSSEIPNAIQMRLKRVVKSLTNKLFLCQTTAGALHPQRHPSSPTHPPPTAT